MSLSGTQWPEPESEAAPLVVSRKRNRPARMAFNGREYFFKANGVEVSSGRRRIASARDILFTQLKRVHLKCPGYFIHCRFDGVGRGGASRGTIRHCLGFIGYHVE